MTCATSWAINLVSACDSPRPNQMSFWWVKARAFRSLALSCARASLWTRTCERSAPIPCSSVLRVVGARGEPEFLLEITWEAAAEGEEPDAEAAGAFWILGAAPPCGACGSLPGPAPALAAAVEGVLSVASPFGGIVF